LLSRFYIEKSFHFTDPFGIVANGFLYLIHLRVRFRAVIYEIVPFYQIGKKLKIIKVAVFSWIIEDLLE
jgi:hypothetical protein